jgi:hypothetical protein
MQQSVHEILLVEFTVRLAHGMHGAPLVLIKLCLGREDTAELFTRCQCTINPWRRPTPVEVVVAWGLTMG